MMTVGLDRRLPILRDQELLTSIDGSLAALRDSQQSVKKESSDVSSKSGAIQRLVLLLLDFH